MNRVDDFLSAVKLGELMHTKKEEERKANKWIVIASIIGIIVIVGIIAYTVYKVLTPEEFEEDYDDFEEGFDDFDDEDDDFDEEFEDVEDDDFYLRKVPKPLKVVNDSDYDSDDED